MADRLGTDTDARDDLPLVDSQVSGIQNVFNALYRRLTTPTGALQFVGDDPTYGFAIQNLVNDVMTPAQAHAYQSIIRSQIMKDPRVIDAEVVITLIA